MKKATLMVLPLLVFVVVALTSCSKDKGASFAQVHGKEYSMKEFHSFSAMVYNDPIIDRSFGFPGKKSVVSLFVETKVFSKKAAQYKKHVLSAPDRKWKNYFVPGQLFMKNYVLQK